MDLSQGLIGRRRSWRTNSGWSNGVWVVTEDLKFVSDPVWFGRHIAELNATNHALVRSYVWGLDLSETLDGAGGVGGLLWVRLASGLASGTHFVTYDGNGNGWQLVYASTGTETAHYEYGPFGEALRTTGLAGASNPFRFSTKRADPATGLVLYEYRAYTFHMGRWTTTDPLPELGCEAQCRNPASRNAGQVSGIHIVWNDPILVVNRLGLPHSITLRFLGCVRAGNPPSFCASVLAADSEECDQKYGACIDAIGRAPNPKTGKIEERKWEDICKCACSVMFPEANQGKKKEKCQKACLRRFPTCL